MVEKKPDSRGRIPTSIKIDPDLWKEAKIEAITRNMDLSEMVEGALRKELKPKESAEQARETMRLKRKHSGDDY
ncbi:hypothetical protein [Candidatus Nitrosocosmicus sp. SS]|jgi:hypothetical protein|uniref:hypothetical protein n=1 Tax=Candidatus Nitrosocosmicus agrestis TaxID=2563600 RepID=UPI00122E0A49|nr:hypothetical protein [Candidatus Nitrosocosmicus sp. SS]KAA2283863.1 hypothetical protein F1Z66_00890 [Candidatus Nitrosocosmicus sp. SS]KAF0870239.1 hypothetical protein E5N71_01605 [Candidatus Nitrosocosmicus sp. SS]